MNYHFKYSKAKEGGYWAQCVEIEGCITQAETLTELRTNAEDALNLMLDEPADSKLIFNQPRKAKARERNIIAVSVRPNVAFAFLLRQLRLRAGLTQQQAAKRLGFDNIYSYQRLESSRKANPRLDLIVRVKTLFPEFDLSLVIGGTEHKRAS
jgi:antitoxin HicB